MKQKTTVTWTLASENNGTRLQLEHTGFIGFRAILISHVLGRGWLNFLQRLPAVLDQLARNQVPQKELGS